MALVGSAEGVALEVLVVLEVLVARTAVWMVRVGLRVLQASVVLRAWGALRAWGVLRGLAEWQDRQEWEAPRASEVSSRSAAPPGHRWAGQAEASRLSAFDFRKRVSNAWQALATMSLDYRRGSMFRWRATISKVSLIRGQAPAG